MAPGNHNTTTPQPHSYLTTPSYQTPNHSLTTLHTPKQHNTQPHPIHHLHLHHTSTTSQSLTPSVP
ncbi:hypothetical protein E2C01_090126 [Portunus trituberculatus]|uniref:Uncharacterized protein n=1 Tax=Portunus trituberculatus TaxID=210409 RepID=A0A5B7JRD5_PORTR|nr:hypothetical protein [Portunus trituberculatus]